MRVENVKGAVWTVDELEFYKRRPQRSTTAAAAAVVFSSSATSPTAMNTASSSTTSIVDLMTNTNAFGFGSVSNDTIVNPSKGNNGRFSPNLQNTWSFGSAINNEVSSAEFSCINSEHYRNFVTGLHLQSLTQRHRFHQQKSTAQCIHPKSQLQQSAIRNNTYNQQHNTRSLHQENAYHIYHTIQEDDQNPQLRHDQQQNQDIITNNTDKYFDHKMECHNESNNNYKYESFHSGQHQQQLFSIRHHLHHTRSAENNNLYFAHHNGQEIDVKYNPALLEQNLSRSDVNMRNKRSKSANKSTDAAAEEDDSGIVDCDSDEIHSKRKKKYIFSLDYDDIEIKMESGSESGIRNIDLPLRTKSY